MSDPRYQHEEVVWCKCGGLFWPAEVRSLESLPVEIREGFLWMPRVVVKFFEEEGYEFVKDDKNIFKYECERKEEFIKKGLARSRCKAKEGATGGWFAKFPKDVIHCEKVTGGDVDLLEKQPFAEVEKIDYSKIFGDGTPSKKKSKAKEVTPAKKAKKRKSEQPLPKAKKAKTASTPVRVNKPLESYNSSDYQVKILTQPSTPYHIDLQKKVATPASNAGYTCKTCEFSTTRLNVYILHNKSHSEPPPKPKPSSSKGNKVKSERKKPMPSTAKLTANKGKSEKIRKPRPTKKQKEEQNQNQKRKEEEKKLILGDWSEDESEEEEEIKKLTGCIDNEGDDLFTFDDDKYDGVSPGSSPALDKSEDDLSKSPASEPYRTLDSEPVKTPDSELNCAQVSSPMSSTLPTGNKIQTTNKSPEAC